MDKKEFIIPITFISLSILFAIICIVVYFTKGKSEKWIARKMKIGAILLTLSTVSCNQSNDPDDKLIICYVPAPENMIVLDAHTNDTLKIDLDTNNVLTGSVYGVKNSDFSFAIVNNNEVKVQKGSLVPDDGSFDTDTEKFSMELNETLTNGVYNIEFFASKIEEQDNTTNNTIVKLKIE